MSVTAAASSKLFGKLEGARRFADKLAVGAAGFILSGASIMQSAVPFGLAWAGAMQPELSPAASAGAALGYLLLSGGDGGMRYAACVAVLLALRWTLAFISPPDMTLLSPFLAASAAAVTGLAAALTGEPSGYRVMIAVCEAAVTATAAMLFGKSYRAIADKNGLSGANGICTVMLSCALYMGLSAIDIGWLSPAHGFAAAAILCCGFYSGTGPAAAAAAAAGLSAAAVGEPHMMFVYCSGGLACGVFAPLGRRACCTAMTAAFIAAHTFELGFDGAGPLIVEAALGCAALAVLPSSLLSRLGIAAPADGAEGEMLKRAVISQLCRFREALGDIAAVSGEVSQKLSEIGSDPIETVFAKSCSAVCRGCQSSPRCWQAGYTDTADALNRAFAAARENGFARPEDLPGHFSCERMDSMLAAINEQTTGYITRRMERRHMAQLRSVSGDQFGGMGDLLASMQSELESFCCAPPKISEAVAKYISSAQCGQHSVCCYLDSRQRISILVELPSYKAARLLDPEVTADLSEIVMQELCRPEHISSGAVSRIRWSAAALFAVESAFLQHAAGSGKFCGDSCRVIDSAMSRAVMLLCDGMGVGSPAAVDATLTTTLLERLLCAGADFPSSLRLVNAALLSGGGEERLCTVDAALLDLQSCRLDIYKAGAAPTFVIRRGKCRKIESHSLPVGILSGAEARHTSLSMAEGDTIVMLSDGVIDSGCDWIPTELQALSGKPPGEICERLLAAAHERRLSEREDDMTVIAARITAA